MHDALRAKFVIVAPGPLPPEQPASRIRDIGIFEMGSLWLQMTLSMWMCGRVAVWSNAWGTRKEWLCVQDGVWGCLGGICFIRCRSMFLGVPSQWALSQHGEGTRQKV